MIRFAGRFSDGEIVSTLWRQLDWSYLSFVCYQLMLWNFVTLIFEGGNSRAVAWWSR